MTKAQTQQPDLSTEVFRKVLNETTNDKDRHIMKRVHYRCGRCGEHDSVRLFPTESALQKINCASCHGKESMIVESDEIIDLNEISLRIPAQPWVDHSA